MRTWLIDFRRFGHPLGFSSSIPSHDFADDPARYSEDHGKARDVDQRHVASRHGRREHESDAKHDAKQYPEESTQYGED